MDADLAAARLEAAGLIDRLDRIYDGQYHRFTRAERLAIRQARNSLDRFLERTLREA